VSIAHPHDASTGGRPVKVSELEHIPALRGPRPQGTATVTRYVPPQPTSTPGPWRPSRRSILRGAIVSGTALGFAALGVFPAARNAYADGYHIWTNGTAGPCDQTSGYARNHNCSPGCGPSTVSSGACDSSGWHRTGGSSPVWYGLEPNDCYRNYYDGWYWRVTNCQGCRSLDYRCHDGWTLICYEQCYEYLSICRWIVRCNGGTTPEGVTV
jgi:hypothetical protein